MFPRRQNTLNLPWFSNSKIQILKGGCKLLTSTVKLQKISFTKIIMLSMLVVIKNKTRSTFTGGLRLLDLIIRSSVPRVPNTSHYVRQLVVLWGCTYSRGVWVSLWTGSLCVSFMAVLQGWTFLTSEYIPHGVFPQGLDECAIVYSFTAFCSPVQFSKEPSSPSKSYFYIMM